MRGADIVSDEFKVSSSQGFPSYWNRAGQAGRVRTSVPAFETSAFSRRPVSWPRLGRPDIMATTRRRGLMRLQPARNPPPGRDAWIAIVQDQSR
jgi:hypothetical protein